MIRTGMSSKQKKLDQLKLEIDEFSSFLGRIAQMPRENFQREFYERLNQLEYNAETLPESKKQTVRSYFAERCREEFKQSDMIRHSFEKPYGYAGDYQIIDWIYTYQASRDDKGKLWDEFFHEQAAPQSVRNRSEELVRLWNREVEKHRRPISVLNIASGPCRDLSVFLRQMNPIAVGSYFHCVDMDPNAIAYGQQVVQDYQSRARFFWEVANAFRLRPKQQFDLVWSAGLFDYLNDRLAIALIRRMWSWARPGGTVIVGNFHPSNPSRTFMEWCGQWFLIYRDEKDFRRLCEEAEIPSEHIQLHREPLGACIFLVLEKPAVVTNQDFSNVRDGLSSVNS